MKTAYLMKEQVKRLFDEYETELNNVRNQVEKIENAIYLKFIYDWLISFKKKWGI